MVRSARLAGHVCGAGGAHGMAIGRLATIEKILLCRFFLKKRLCASSWMARKRACVIVAPKTYATARYGTHGSSCVAHDSQICGRISRKVQMYLLFHS